MLDIYEERQILEKLLKKDISKRQIGNILKKSHSTILYELKHHSGKTLDYSAERAQLIYEKRQLNKGNKKKIDCNVELKEFIIKSLKEDWSPEQIAGSLKRDHQETIGYVCHETIYAYIYSPEHKKDRYFIHLRRHKPKQIKWYTRQKRKIKIPDRISIHNRPEEIKKRVEGGHWETDSMIFSQQKGILSVQIERVSRAVRIHKCQDKTAEKTYEALMKTKDSLPDYYFKSFTFDNGTENVKHIRLKEEFGIETYFCDPYCSWQKGAVENINMFIRQYLPRCIKLENITDEQIYNIQEKLNNRPRKCLNYLTPNIALKFLHESGRF